MALTHWYKPDVYAARKAGKADAKTAADEAKGRLDQIDKDRTKMTPAEVRTAVADCAALLRRILAAL